MMNNSTKNKLVNLEIENRKSVLKLYDEIIPVVKKFDGKILNKRFDTALKAVDKHLYCDRSFSFFRIEIYVENNYVRNKPDKCGICCASYVTTRNISLTSLLYGCPDKTFPDKVMVDSDNRIKSDVILKALEEGKESIEKEIISFEESLTKIEDYKKKLEELKAEIEKTTKEIPYLIRDYFELNYTVRKN